MEYLEGESLEARLRKGPIPIEEALQIAIQIAGALDSAHRRGMVHRDLKPGNVMLTKGGAKLLDFGLAKMNGASGLSRTELTQLTAAQPITVQGTILGTLQYISPEQLEGKEADARSDIFSFGTMLYEMITGRKGFRGIEPGDLDCGRDVGQPAAGVDASPDGVAGAGPAGAQMPGEVPGRTLADCRGSFQRAEMDCGNRIGGRRARARRGEASQPGAHGVDRRRPRRSSPGCIPGLDHGASAQ
jgi:serine/threonine protein kinase